MQILSSTVDMLRWALARWDRDSMVELSQACRWGQDNILKYDVNWSCCGSVSVEVGGAVTVTPANIPAGKQIKSIKAVKKQ